MGKTFSTGLLTNGIWQDASNNIGIGGSPSGSYKLEVTGTAGINSTVAGYGLTLTNIQDSSQGLLVRATDNDTSLNILNLQSSVGATSQTWVDRFTVTKGGNVGINTTSPSEQLNLMGANAYTSKIRFTNGVSNTSYYTNFGYNSDGNKIYLQIADGASASNIMTWNYNGNVGIGTTSATGKLMLYQPTAGNVLQNIVSNQGGSTQVGINLSPSMTDTEVAANPAQASIYATDSNYGANIIFANKTTGAVGNALTERMKIQSDGGIQMGFNVVGDPTYLRVRNTNTGGYPSSLAISIYGYAVAAGYFDPIRIQASYPGYGSTSFIVKYQPNSAEISALQLRGDGIVFLPGTLSYTTSASANLNMGAAGDIRYSTASSQRYKDNIEDWSGNGLDTILALKPRTFNYKESYYSNPDVKMLGLIAEEVAEVSTYLADYENEDRTGQVENVRYANIVVPLIAAIKELSSQNQDLKSRLDKAGL